MPYRLLDQFRRTFEGREYRHRSSNQGDMVAIEFYEDLLVLDPTSLYSRRVTARTRVVSGRNTRRGITARRGDGTFGELIPNTPPAQEPNFGVWRGEIATVEIGIETKIFSKAMVKQWGRVASDLTDQLAHFRRGGGTPICVAVVGVNHAARYTSFEKDRVFATDGSGTYRHPAQEAPEIERRLDAFIRPIFDELIVLRYEATNEPPYLFRWVDESANERDYGAALTRVLRRYDARA